MGTKRNRTAINGNRTAINGNRTAINGNRTAINGNRTAINGNRTANQNLKKLQDDYNRQAELRKAIIRDEPNRFKRFFRWLWYLISFPWVWLFYNIRDWRSAICLVVSLVLWSSSVWIFYLLYFITQNEWFLGIGTAVWAWWLSPVGSPFLLLSTLTAIGIKSVINSLHNRRHNKNDKH